MSTITLTLTTTTVTATGAPLTITASVTNSASVPARIVLAAFAPLPGQAGAAPASAREWAVVDRPLRELPAGGTEQFTITITPPAEAAAGEHVVRFIAYDNDRPPEEYSDQARQVQVVVPARPAPAAPGVPWWIWVAAAVLVVVVGVVAFLVLRPVAEPELPSSSPTPTATATPTPTKKATGKPPVFTTRPTVLPTKKTTLPAPTKVATAAPADKP